MQLQLSLKIADRLHHDLLVRGEPIEATEAARVLLSASTVGDLPLDVLDILVRDDRRFCWVGGTRDSLALTSWQDGDADLSAVPFVALDLETTGAKAGLGKITEIGAVRIEGLSLVAEFHSLVNPQRAIPPMITQITGITESMVADAPRIEEVIPGLLEFLEGAVVVAHNAPFDVGFLNYELHRLRSRRLDDGAIDTLPLSRAFLPGLTNYKLQTIAEALGSPVTAYHRALEDARAVAHVFVHLAGLLQSEGLSSLSALRQHGRSSAPAALEKLRLTRDLPEGPGTYTFLGEEDEVLLVGSAAHLVDEVRKVFVPGPRLDKGRRTAVRLVERIDHEQAATPLEAVVREHELLLEHHPPHNQFRSSPDRYAYIRAGGSGPAARLFTTRNAPSWLCDTGSAPAANDLVIGPFRRRSSARAALSTLASYYPIRHCPRQPDSRPCERGVSGRCLSPCTAGPEIQTTHDALVMRLLQWLAGENMMDGWPDPLRHIEDTIADLKHHGENQEAKAARDARDHLLVIRRAYARLADARQLNFALLWPRHTDGRATVRLNVVLAGLLRTTESLFADDFEERLDQVFGELSDESTRLGSLGVDGLIAVPQKDLDPLLGVRRWFRETTRTDGALVSLQDTSPGLLVKAKTQLVSEAGVLFARQGHPVTRHV